MGAFQQDPSYPEPMERFWPWLARTNPALMSRVNALDETINLEAFLVGGAVQRESDLFHEKRDGIYRRVARSLTGKLPDLSDPAQLNEYLFGPSVIGGQARAENKADAIADTLIRKMGNEPPPFSETPHEGTDGIPCADDPGFGDADIERLPADEGACADPNCPCWQDGFDSGYDTALEDLGIDPDDEPDGAA